MMLPTGASSDQANTRPTTLAIPQDRETPVTVSRVGDFSVRYLYGRARETQVANEKGQDYLTFRSEGRRLTFALCDGVGQSFFGDIAARFLGDRMVEWLWNNLPAVSDKEVIASTLANYLSGLSKEAEGIVAREEIPPDLPLLHQTVLQRKKDYGSECTFAAGVIELANSDEPKGRVVLCWMGNTEMQIRLRSQKQDEKPSLPDDWDDKCRWSSRRGLVGGQPHVFVSTTDFIQRVIAYSDGLNVLRSSLDELGEGARLQEEADRLSQLPSSDDVSYLEIFWAEKTEPNAAAMANPQSVNLDIA